MKYNGGFMIIGGIEAGGTKFVCGIGNEKGE
ncbi:fructokinase, partial [Fusobacterium perfoetens]|nr:fructokinase [Fusobacterium perfoetens]